MPSNKIKNTQVNLEERIIELLKGSPLHKSEIFRRLKVRKNRDHRIVKRVLENLDRNKKILRDKKGIYKITSSKDLVVGKITITSQGFGFVTPLNVEMDEDIFIPAKHVNSAFDKDMVKVRIFSKNKQSDPDKGPAGIVYEVIERNRPGIVGELISGNDGVVLRPLSRKIPNNIKIIGSLNEARIGDWVKADIIYSGEKNKRNKTVGEIVQVIGKVGDINNDMFAIIQEYNLLPPYTEEEQNRASSLKQVEVERQDLTSLFSLTIDPHDAKDFDDAISVSPGNKKDECIMGIHIADVASWIQPGTWFDTEAAARGFSSYIPGYTLPMLPKNLTKRISLTSDKISEAHTVLLTIDTKTGEIKNYKRCHSKIKVAFRLTYMEVENYIKDKTIPKNWTKELTDNLDILLSTYHTFRANRKKNEKFLEIVTTEIRILRDDETGVINGLERKKQGDSNQLVEEFMLAANSAVARELTNSKIPGIYRIHPEPDEEKLEEFSAFVGQTFGISTGNLASGREACQHFLKKISGSEYEEIIISAFLRSMNRALYSAESGLHFGLGKGLYSHFTSPIRRYTDLTVHQQLWEYDKSRKLRGQEQMSKVALDCTEKEKNNDEAYFAANDRLKLHYLLKLMEDNELENYKGIVRHISSYSMIADIPDLGLVGYIPAHYITKKQSKNSSNDTKTDYKPGDLITLKLEKVDLIKGDAIFKPI
ncbi:MAG: VacB/RNase II family 3'-5' exoribonuclease [bacterium]|nr:VacB/RNase II family 3'-5' exoribonuclease [bacterium]